MENCYDIIEKSSIHFGFIKANPSLSPITNHKTHTLPIPETQHKTILTMNPAKPQGKKPKRRKPINMHGIPVKTSKEIYDFLSLNN